MPGQNYVFGQNWQGKSSVVDAIGFALFGVDLFPKKMAGTAVKADHLMNERSTSGRVDLTFELDGAEYALTRHLLNRHVELKKNRESIASGIRTVNEKLVSLLGIDAKLFQNIFFSDQDELRKSLDFSPEERRVFIERLLGVEEWKNRIESLRDTRKRLGSFLDDLTSGRLGVFLSHVEDLHTQIEDKTNELRELEASIKTLAKRTPKDLRELRRDERKAEQAVADRQHEETKLLATLDLEEKLREGLKRGKCPTCTQVIPPPLRKSRLAQLGASIRQIERRLGQIQRDIAKQERALEDEDFGEAQEQFVELSELKARRAEMANQLASDDAQLKRLRQQAKAFGKKPKQVEDTKAEIEFLTQLESAIQEFRRVLRGRLVRQLTLASNDFLARFHDGDNDSSVQIDDELNVGVKLHGHDVPIFNLSGAAKDILALAMRYGLLRVAARGIDFLVLDEPTRHMDTQNCQRLKLMFNDLLDRQLIVVTINSEFSDATGRHFRVAKDDSLHSVIAETW